MNRHALRKMFKTAGPAVLPVIHVLDYDQTVRNVCVTMREGAQGVFLINHDFEYQKLLPIVCRIRSEFPWLWMGLNFLAVTGKEAFPVLSELQRSGTQVDAYWADDARIDECSATQTEAEEIDRARSQGAWNGLYFGGTAFKKQRPVAPEHYSSSAAIATQHMDIVTTSGVATGCAADMQKIRVFRKACAEQALAIASGITPENVSAYAPCLDAILVATGINQSGDFYNIDAQRLRALLRETRLTALPESKDN
ncbi:MAG: BtpA/SgcQ family protein [Granulosicoccus sp.]